jgi:hypothetical protein
MRKKISVACFLLANGIMAGSAYAGVGDFTNGNFSALTGWTQGGGTFNSALASPYIMDPASYLSGTSNNTIITVPASGAPAASVYDPVLSSGGGESEYDL